MGRVSRLGKRPLFLTLCRKMPYKPFSFVEQGIPLFMDGL
jgi:hypothetical protein